jgi:hypothetical protein
MMLLLIDFTVVFYTFKLQAVLRSSRGSSFLRSFKLALVSTRARNSFPSSFF